jgi:hypothetical protein
MFYQDLSFLSPPSGTFLIKHRFTTTLLPEINHSYETTTHEMREASKQFCSMLISPFPCPRLSWCLPDTRIGFNANIPHADQGHRPHCPKSLIRSKHR